MADHTVADKKRVFALYERGLSIYIIEDLTGIPASTAAYWLRQAGRIRSRGEAQRLRHRHGAYPEARARREKTRRIVRLYQQPGASCRSVGERLSLDKTTVHYHLRSDYALHLMHGEYNAQQMLARQD